MAVRQMINIDEELCDGCGECVPSCAEGAIQIIGGKAKLVSEIYCDGLGVCLGACPTGALTIEEVEAQAFDPEAVEVHLAKLQGAAGATAAGPALLPLHGQPTAPAGGGCPGSRAMSFDAPAADGDVSGVRPSQLRQWPVQLHLVPPQAPWFQDADVLLAADCTAFAMGDFHKDWLKGRGLAVACPKLDQNQEVYLQKLTAMIDQARVRSLTVMVMEVPCCGGLVQMTRLAAEQAKRKIPVRIVVVGVQGEIVEDLTEAAGTPSGLTDGATQPGGAPCSC